MKNDDMPSVQCEQCGSSNNVFADICWVCLRPLAVADQTKYQPSQKPQGMSAGRILLTVFGTILLAFAFFAALVIVLFFVCIAALSGAGI